MRKLKEILRLKLDCGLEHRQIQRAVGVSIGAVSKYCGLAEQAGLTWRARNCLPITPGRRYLIVTLPAEQKKELLRLTA